ncbi:uncharacterized protein LOC135335773 isoform X2 [Halichondria panicea]|uniref:uncharacterized protein LOC135335773 isoform X2 n=1 Tax=Halichondria panicea TaxID=6063 RepID=UPI00312B7A12
MKLLTTIAVVTVLVAACEAGSKCVWGPSYWCQSPSTAKECGQETYCQQAVWMAKKEKVGGALECDMCKLVVNKIEGLVETKSTEIDIEVEVKKLCQVAGPLNAACRSFIDQYFDQIWKMVTKELDAKTVCDMIKMCAPSKTVQLAAAKPENVGDACSLCKTVTGFLKSFVDSNSSEPEIKTALEDFCKLFPTNISKECTDLVDSKFVLIWVLVKAEVDSGDICYQVDLCNKTLLSLPRKTSPKGLGDACSTCTLVVNYIKSFVDGNYSEDEVKTALETLCKVLPGNISTDCTNLVDSKFDLIWTLLKAEVDSGDVCKQIGLCNTTLSLPHKTSPKGLGDACSTCTLVVNFIKNFVDGNYSEDEVKTALESLCKVLPGNISTDCTNLVDSKFDLIWTLLKAEVDSGDVCKQIGLCNTTLSLPHKTSPKGLGDACSTCTLVVNFIKNFVDASSSEDEVKTALETLCKVLPGNISTDCTNLVDSKFDLIWTLLKAEVDSGDVCKQIGLCNTTLSLPHKVPKGGEECELCKVIVSYLDLAVNKNSTEKEIETAVEDFCRLIKSTKCTSLITEYFGVVWQLVKGELNNDEFCKQTNMCPSLSRVAISVPTVSVVCDVCKLVVPFLRNFIDNNKTETEAKAAVEGLCSKLPNSYEDECTSLVDNYFGLIWKYLESYTDDEQICSDLELCSKSKVTVSLQRKLPQAGVGCVLCEFVLKEVYDVLDGNTTEAAIKNALDQVCDILPSSLKSECQELVDTYTPQIINFIEQELTPEEICTKLTLCTSTIKVFSPKVSSPKAGVECIMCDFVMKELEKLLGENSTEAEIKAALDKVCSYLPKTVNSTCVSLVDNYLDDIVKAIVNGATPDEVCTVIKLCTTSAKFSSLKVSSPKAGVGCILCEFVIKEVDSLIGNNNTEAAITSALEKVCSILPKTIQTECVSLVDQYADEIIQALVNGLSPDQVCTTIKLCTSVSKVSSPKAGVGCILCEFVIKEVDSLIGNNNTEAAITSALEKVCSILPKTIQTECVSLVDQYADEIIQALVNGLSPDQVCTTIKLCTSVSKVSSPKAGVGCILCEFVIKEVDSLIGNNNTEAAITSALEKVCSILPKTIQTECVSLVDQYADEIIQALVDGLSPDQVCTTIKLCTSVSKVSSPKASATCVLCEFAMKELDSLLEKNSTETEIEQALEKVCSILPATIQSECKTFMTLYTPDIIAALEQELDPKTVCTAIKLCTNSAVRVTSPKAGPLCVICEYVIEKLVSLINGNITEAAIEKALDEVCSVLPSSIKDECVTFVDKYAPEIVTLLLDGAATKAICTLLHLCLFEQQPLVKNPKAATECDVCKFTINSVKSLIDSNSSEKTVEGALEKACSLLPKEISGECEGIVQEYGAPIIQLLDNEIDATKLCEDVKLCKKSNKKAVNLLMKPWLKMARARQL